MKTRSPYISTNRRGNVSKTPPHSCYSRGVGGIARRPLIRTRGEIAAVLKLDRWSEDWIAGLERRLR